MIEIETSKTGLPILKVGGCLLSSSYDPINEAQSWLEGVSPRIKNFETFILLGLGSAYHCLALKKLYPKKSIVVLECNAQLIKKSIELFFDLNSIQIYQISDSKEIFSLLGLIFLTKKPFYTVRLPSTRFTNSKLFDEVETVLTGRSSYEFSKFCKMRPQLSGQLDLERLIAANLISIKDVSNAFIKTKEKLTLERRIHYILEELIL